jgi:hypothetical protein
MWQTPTPDVQETPTSPPVAGPLHRRSVLIAEQVRAFNPAEQRLAIEDVPRISIRWPWISFLCPRCPLSAKECSLLLR